MKFVISKYFIDPATKKANSVMPVPDQVRDDGTMETFGKLKPFVDNPHYDKQRGRCLGKLDIHSVDAPIMNIVRGFCNLPYCFTLQSCYGHFVHKSQTDPYNVNPLSSSRVIGPVEYRIAYMALCIENSEPGKALFGDFEKIPDMDPEYVQFGSAAWFWERQVNSFALQVEPFRYRTKDKISVDFQEALHIEKTRNEFFRRIEGIIQKRSALR